MVVLPVLPVFLVGAAAAQLLKKAMKPVVRGTIKTSVKLGADAKRAAHELNEDLSDIAAEASAEVFTSELQGEKEVPHQTTKKTRPSKASTGT